MDKFTYIIRYLRLLEADVLDTPPTLDNKPIAKKPSMYKALLHNCDYVDGHLVVTLLAKYFHLTDQQAMQIVMAAHRSKLAVIGVYTKDVAESKAAGVMDEAKAAGYDTLLISVEPE